MTRFLAAPRADGRFGIIDTTKKMFAHFFDATPTWVPSAKVRAERTADRLNSGDETTTGYVWEKL